MPITTFRQLQDIQLERNQKIYPEKLVRDNLNNFVKPSIFLKKQKLNGSPVTFRRSDIPNVIKNMIAISTILRCDMIKDAPVYCIYLYLDKMEFVLTPVRKINDNNITWACRFENDSIIEYSGLVDMIIESDRRNVLPFNFIKDGKKFNLEIVLNCIRHESMYIDKNNALEEYYNT